MRKSLLAFVLLLAGLAGDAGGAAAQQRARTASTMWGAVGIYNDAGTMRVNGPLDVPAEREIPGDVAVLNGPVTVAGRVTGTLVAINADVRLKAGARIGGDLFLVGGTLTRDDSVTVGGEVRTQAELLRYSIEGERIVPEEDRGGEWRPPRARGRDRGDSYTDLFFVAARTYNRVEGLPVLVGPRFRRPTSWGRIDVEALGVVRTAGPVRWDRGTIGHDARFDLRLGVRNGLVLSGRAFDVVAPVESWQLTDTEAGLAAFGLHRDFRDHYGRHGWEAALGGRMGEEASLSVVAGSEQWRAVEARDPVSLRQDMRPWRPNAPMDVGRVDLASVRLKVDTRQKVRSPLWGGWYLNADVERGSGTITRDPGPTLPPVGPAEEVTYTRGFVDARRYNRISPGTELNLRLVAGGWMGGDRLPLQRRLSVGGPGSIEGYDFRRNWYETDDVFSCGGIAGWTGRPTLCDRIALAQVELRQAMDWDWYDSDRWWRFRDLTPAWVLFADAGRGWTTPASGDPVSHGTGLPPLSSFRTSVGAGIDLGDVGFYVAKAVSTPKETVNFYVRLGRRF
ncbi:MAG: outer membrane protein assembly factor [Gemmatimonadaceae bacterium]|nr:outer membrane protein assembly factor [Gemmatimonadaceae bacterium]